MIRRVEPELLDELPAADPRAIQSRRDLRRINFWMGHARVMARLLRASFSPTSVQRVIDLGGGDGTFLLGLARRLGPIRRPVEAVIVDRQNLLVSATQEHFERLGWNVAAAQMDVFDWLAHESAQGTDWIVANLFLHHFEDEALQKLFHLAAEPTRVFLACEPRRSALCLTAARCLWLLGCNSTTRHDAVASVRAGFSNRELSRFWPEHTQWQARETRSGLFSHCFFSRRLP